MKDGIHERSNATDSQAAGQKGLGHSSRNGFRQCRQCTENFPRFKMVCPRCSRINDRSPVVLGLKALALVLFVSTMSWVVWAVSTRKSPPPEVDNVTVVPQKPVATETQPDVRF